MGIQENIAEMLRAIKANSGKTTEGWSEELGIASSTLQEYLKGDGNPTVKMDISPIALMAGDLDSERYQTVLLMLDSTRAVSVLSQPKRVRFAELFLELVLLWENEE